MEKEVEIVLTLREAEQRLNAALTLAADNGIQCRLDEVDITTMGDKVARRLLHLSIYKAL